jgi:hypothetical protein
MENFFPRPEKKKNCQLNNISKIEEEIKTFHDKQKLKESMTIQPVLQKILKGILHTEKDKCNQENTGKNKLH